MNPKGVLHENANQKGYRRHLGIYPASEPMSCSETVADSSQYARASWNGRNINQDGEFYTTIGSYLYSMFIDFTTMASAAVCSMPNCTHTDPETCSAHGIDNHPTIYDGSLYYFVTEMGYNSDGDVVDTLYVYKADLDGTNRQKIASVENLSLPDFNRFLMKGGHALLRRKHH